MTEKSYKVMGLTGAQLENVLIFFACAIIVYIAMKFISECFITWMNAQTEIKLKRLEIESKIYPENDEFPRKYSQENKPKLAENIESDEDDEIHP